MGSPLGHTLANGFLEFDESQWLKYCLIEFKTVYYPFHVNEIFVLLESSEQLVHFQNHLNSMDSHISFLSEPQFNKKMSFLDVEIFRQNGGLPVNQRLLIWITLYYYI